MKIYIYPYKMGSRSASDLAQLIGCGQIRHRHSKFIGGTHKTVINWGASELPREVNSCVVLNHSDYVKRAGNKLEFFKLTNEEVSLVPWTTKKEVAEEWFKDNKTVVCRKLLTSHSGNGIILASKETGVQVVAAPLYTRYIPKDSEWRIHLINKDIVDIQRKVRDPDREPKDWKVRSHHNGFLFIRDTAPPPKDVLEQAKAAFLKTGLDFGAADVIYNKHTGKAYVLEINTAPGLQGATIAVYKENLLKLINQ